jgi:hypothetical protein
MPGRTGMIVMGFGRTFIKAVKRIVRLGQSGTKRALRELEEVIIGAKLIRVNDERPKDPIQGHVTVRVDLSQRISVAAQGVSKRARSAWEDIKLSVKRIR